MNPSPITDAFAVSCAVPLNVDNPAEIENVFCNATSVQNDCWPKDLCTHRLELHRTAGNSYPRLARAGVKPQAAETDRAQASCRIGAWHRQRRACGLPERRHRGR